ncbi:MAG: Txe/YoeB family addiction module toxin [Alphaproteobacteria bacterium]
MDLYFTNKGLEHYRYWQKNNKGILERINLLIEDIKIEPYVGIGKPEPLKHQLSGTWSRRIDREHRLVYFIKKQEIWILNCRGHYKT